MAILKNGDVVDAEDINRVLSLTQPIDNTKADQVGTPSLTINPATGGLVAANLKGNTGNTGSTGSTGAQGVQGWGFYTTTTSVSNISAISGMRVGDYILCAWQSTGTLLAVLGGSLRAAGAVIRATSATTGEEVGNIRGENGSRGATGATGAKGDKGDDGNDFMILGHSDYEYQLPTNPELGTAYTVGTVAPFDVYIYLLRNGSFQWLNMGQIQGAKGERGYTGLTGATGATGTKGDKGDFATASEHHELINGVDYTIANGQRTQHTFQEEITFLKPMEGWHFFEVQTKVGNVENVVPTRLNIPIFFNDGRVIRPLEYTLNTIPATSADYPGSDYMNNARVWEKTSIIISDTLEPVYGTKDGTLTLFIKSEGIIHPSGNGTYGIHQINAIKGKDADMSNLYTKAEVDGMVAELKAMIDALKA